MHGEPKYSKDFENVEYINPNSIKGGSIVRSAIGTYDSFNPFILKGTSAAFVMEHTAYGERSSVPP